MTQGNRKQNKELVDKALEEILVPGLKPFIQRKMKAKYGKNWLEDSRLGLQDYHFEGDDLKWQDPQVVIKLVLDQWNDAFREPPRFDHSQRRLVNELLEIRNAVKHNDLQKFDNDYTYRALDSMALLLSATFAKKEAQEIEQQKEEFRQRWLGNVQVEEKPEAVISNQPAPVAESPGVRHPFQAVISEKTEGFVGREFVFQAIEEFLVSQPNGYFIIEAEPGVGKSAIAAEYVRRNECVAHFNVRSQGINRADQFLDSVCTQIISRYHLPYPSLPSDATRDGKFLAQLLGEVGAKLKRGERLVIVIDALDEVDQTDHSGANILYLPATLPKGIYILITRRPVTLPFTVNAPQQLFDLMAYQDESLQDIQTYIRGATQRQQLRAWIDAQELTVDEFIIQLADKSENNFMYLRYVLTEIERGVYRDFSMETLPQGLQAYYEEHWRRMGMMDKQRKRTKIKIVYVLAELREPVSRQLIAEFASEDAFTVQEVLDQWEQFLRQEYVDGQSCYSIYHLSFCDFLSRKDIVQAAGVTLQGINALIADNLTQGVFGDG